MRDIRQAIRRLSKRDGRFRPEAYVFLLESLEPAIRLAGREEAQGPDRHITGQELLTGLCSQAGALFGPLAAHVWRAWGVHEALDWGRIVFLLVEDELLNRRETDSIDDFRQDLDFEEVFVQHYELVLPTEIGPASA